MVNERAVRILLECILVEIYTLINKMLITEYKVLYRIPEMTISTHVKVNIDEKLYLFMSVFIDWRKNAIDKRCNVM